MSELNMQHDILEQLHDIHLPAAASNGPLAPGWIILIILLLVIGCSIIIFIVRNYPVWQTKKHAQHLLKQYQAQYLKTPNSQKTCALVNELLKKTAFFYYPRTMVASLTGQDWLNFLNQTMLHKPLIQDMVRDSAASLPHYKRGAIYNYKLGRFYFLRIWRSKPLPDFNNVAKELLDYPYQNPQNVDLHNLFSIASIWIKKQRQASRKHKEKPCSS